MKRLWALVYKEMLQIIRDPSSILIAFVLPFILLFIWHSRQKCWFFCKLCL